MVSESATISALTEKIRALINDLELTERLTKDDRAWLQLCSCLDALEDTELAVDAYVAHRPFGNPAEKYLAVYGVLQALFLQQDAAINLCEALKMQETINSHPTLREIREIRNDSIGHPTKRNRKKGQKTSYNFISRPTLEHEGFDLLCDDGTFKSQHVTIHELILKQRNCICGLLQSAIARLGKMKAKIEMENKGE